jgi:hypothetical protein
MVLDFFFLPFRPIRDDEYVFRNFFYFGPRLPLEGEYFDCWGWGITVYLGHSGIEYN